MSLVVGHIQYINCAPFFHYLSNCGFGGTIVNGVPSHLNHLLAEGGVDVSPSSSFEYARNWRKYLLLPELSISACGPVRSVLLFSGRPIDTLSDFDIALTGDSATSVNLLKIILKEFYDLRDVRYAVPEGSVEAVIAEGGSALLIGDQALKSAQEKAAPYIYDLAELWLQHTGLPFVFALWILRRQAVRDKADAVRALQGQLKCSRERAFASLEDLAKATPEREWMGEEGLIEYWNCMSYELGEAHLEGLRFYFHLCVRHHLLDEEPELHFWGA
ncbi:menaquinone biosynthetic enzyme MqnA/MqnD family protein [Trichloromonas sp.]|uniref:menaquinone biosynthetic enzyme MqnA/MqnD family protein n=1 Tax=Trichloromonas sp. TaxID=3069249 RepID=UPI002A4D9CED|nr:menaquinone biosynthesis protein [Trichloromonas sp.]